MIYKESINEASKNTTLIRRTSISQNILALSLDTSFNYSNERFVHTKYVNMSLGKLPCPQIRISKKK